MDITYIPMARGFVYLAVVLDWATRRVLSWRLSITMKRPSASRPWRHALARHGRPEIFNTDQGAQITGAAFTGLLASHDIAISMDGKGAWRDSVFVERLWKSVKYGGSLPARLPERRRGTKFDRPVSQLSQRTTTTFEPSTT